MPSQTATGSMVDLVDLSEIIPEAKMTIGQRVWAEANVGVMCEFAITGIKYEAEQQEYFETEVGVGEFVRAGVFDRNAVNEWKYQLCYIGGKSHGEVFGWLKESEIIAERPEDSWHTVRETKPVPPFVIETI